MNVRPLPLFEADVAAILYADPKTPHGFLGHLCGTLTHRQRISLHRDMGLTPEQSAKEFDPFIDAELHPLYDDDRSFFSEICRTRTIREPR